MTGTEGVHHPAGACWLQLGGSQILSVYLERTFFVFAWGNVM